MPPLSLGSSREDNTCCQTAFSNPFGFGGLNAVVAWEAGLTANIAYSGEPIVLLSLLILIEGGDIPCQNL